MPIDDSHDAPSGLSQRNPEALLSQGAELSHVENINGVLDNLFSRRAEMRALCNEQLSSLYDTKDFYGRTLSVGASASDASSLVNRAFSGK